MGRPWVGPGRVKSDNLALDPMWAGPGHEKSGLTLALLGSGQVGPAHGQCRRELGSERADMLSRTTLEKAQKGSTQSSGCAEGWGLLSPFLNLRILWFLCLWLGWLGLWL